MVVVKGALLLAGCCLVFACSNEVREVDDGSGAGKSHGIGGASSIPDRVTCSELCEASKDWPCTPYDECIKGCTPENEAKIAAKGCTELEEQCYGSCVKGYPPCGNCAGSFCLDFENCLIDPAASSTAGAGGGK